MPIFRVLTEQARTFHALFLKQAGKTAHKVQRDTCHPITLTTIQGGFKQKFFRGQMPFLSYNKKCRSSEGINIRFHTRTVNTK